MRTTQQPTPSEEVGRAEFNQIYNNLVTKIRNRIEQAELPAIRKKEERLEKLDRVREKDTGDFVTLLKKTLKGGQEEERRLEREFGAVMAKGGRQKKKGCKMLYQSLGEVRRNIEAMEKKSSGRLKKVL